MFEISSIDELETLSEKVTWQHFEKLIAFIFEENEFEVEHNVVVVSNHEKKQYDVIAKKPHITYVIECKRWKSRAGVVHAIHDAVDLHIERCAFYSKVHPNEHVIPLLVIFLSGMPEQHKNVFIVPLHSLNWFLNSYEYREE